MSYDLYLSYSGRKSYLTCPRQYEFRYILKAQSDRNPRDSLFGSIIGKLFEWFYERRIWAEPDPLRTMLDLCEPAINHVFRSEKWDEQGDPPLSHTIRSDLRKYIPLSMEIIRKNELLTPYSKAELDLTVMYSSERHGLTLKIGGRADFVHSKDQRDVWLMDGKASQHRDKYVDAEQLIWYAVQHYLKNRVAPSRLGFFFYKFPDDPIKWISYDEDSMRASITQTFDVAKKIHLKVFPTTPSDECRLCDYRSLCDDGIKFMSNKKVEDRVTESIFDLEQI